MEKKFIYEAPEMEQIVLRLEYNQMQSTSVRDSAGNGFTVNDLGDLDDDN